MDLRELLRNRSGANSDAERDVRALVEDPDGRALLLSAGVDLDHIEATLAKVTNVIDVLASSIERLTQRGWAVSSLAPVSAHAEALVALRRAQESRADDILSDCWTERADLLPPRVAALALGEEALRTGLTDRERLVRKAIGHHLNAAWEASIPILLAQAEGIVMDLTVSPEFPRGRYFFSLDERRNADVVDDSTIAGIDGSLSTVRDYFSQAVDSTSHGLNMSRHGVLHGRQPDYDTRHNSSRCIALLFAIVDLARPLASAVAASIKTNRYAAHAGSDEADQGGVRFDRRGFTDTRLRLRELTTAQSWFKKQHGRWGCLDELRADVVARYHVRKAADIRLHLGDGYWSASVRSESGWVFSIASDGEHTFYAEGAADPKTDPPAPPWSHRETPNWSGDVYW